MNKKALAYILILLTCLTTGFAFACFKLVTLEGLYTTHRIIILIAAVILMAANLFLFLTAYRYERISVLYPLTALTYPVTFILGVLIFHEAPTIPKIVGTVIVVIGSYLMARKEVF